MAEGKTVIFKRLQSEVTCPLCLDIFTEPKKLPCDHVYCRVCLRGLALRSITGTIDCPECRRDIPIPANGVADFPTLHQVNRLLEMYQDSLNSDEIEAIDTPQQQKPAETEETSTPQPATCEVHSSQPLALYCETCEKLVCRDCALTSCAKKNHEHGFIDDMVKKYENDLNRELKPVSKLHQEMVTAFESVSALKRELWSNKEAKLQQMEITFNALAEILAQERRYFTDCTEKSFQEQYNIYSTKEVELAEEVAKLDSVIQFVKSASRNGSKSEFLSGVAGLKKDILGEACQNTPSLHPVSLPETESEICSTEDFQEFCHLKNFRYMKSDPLKCHTTRHLDLNKVAVRETSEIPLYLNSQGVKTGVFRKINIAANLHCLHDNSSEKASVRKITNEIYSLSLTPQKQGKHELHIKYNDTHVCGSPMPFFAVVPPQRLRSLSSKEIETSGISVYGGKIYATNTAEGVIKIIDPSSLSVEASIKVPEVNKILVKSPHIYATDATQDRLIKMDMNGTVLASTGTLGDGPGQFNFPNGIRLNRSNELLYVCDTRNQRVQVFDQDLNFISVVGWGKTAKGQFDLPADLDFDEDGNIYVVDERSGGIQVLTPEGEHVRKIDSDRRESPLPVSVAVHRSMVYVTDAANYRVLVFKTTGESVAKFGDELTLFFTPESIAIDENGFVYVSDNETRIVKF